MRGLDPAQRQFELDGVPHAVPATAAPEREATEHEATSTAARTSDATTDDAQRGAAATALSGTVAAPVQQPEAAPDGYAQLFAETERAAEREREQPALFEAQPTPVNVAAAQPLHLDDSPGERGGDTTVEHNEDESVAEDSALTVSQAARQAEIIAELRAELDARTAAAAPAAPRQRAPDPDDEDLDIGASRDDDVDARTDVGQGQGLST
jgi:hypothetical protein